MRIKIFSFLLLFPACTFAGGFSIGGTRLIYTTSAGEADISVSNSQKTAPYLIQSWVSNINSTDKPPFIVTPPLFRLNAGKTNDLRIFRTSGELPSDRESIFYLNIKAIPAQKAPQTAGNYIQFAMKNRIKLIYRPQGLPSTSAAAEGEIQWRRDGNNLVAKNTSPYFITFHSVRFNGAVVRKEADSAMVAPLAIFTFPLKGTASSTGEVQWNAINDYGSDSKTFTQDIH